MNRPFITTSVRALSGVCAFAWASGLMAQGLNVRNAAGSRSPGRGAASP